MKDDSRFFYVILSFVVILTIAAKNLMRTRVGRAFVAIRDRDVAAEVMGVDFTQYKVTAFAISSFYGGIAAASTVTARASSTRRTSTYSSRSSISP